MLHVTSHRGKSSFYKRFVRRSDYEKDETENNIHQEDEVVSTVMGPLDFLSTEENFTFWKHLLKLEHEHTPVMVKVDFWPKRNKKQSGYVEPDAHIVFEFSEQASLNLLIEFKWHAPLSGDNQLHDQWQIYLSDEERMNSLHLFIAPSIEYGIQAKKDNDLWGEKLRLISWLEVRNVFSKIKKQPSALGRWATHADSFLHRVGIQQFNGFKHINSDFNLDKTATLPSVFRKA